MPPPDEIFLSAAGENAAMVAQGIAWMILAVGIAQNLVYLSELPAAWLELRRRSQSGDEETPWAVLTSDAAPPISVLLPAFNEAGSIVASARAALSLRYPRFEVIVVNDGSTDDTLARLIEAFQLRKTDRAFDIVAPHAPIRGIYRSQIFRRLLVIDKENGGGKADASNAGLNCARSPLFCVVDADSILESDSLLRSVRPFMEDPKDTVAVGGTIRIVNGCEIKDGAVRKIALPRNPLALVQSLEYLRAFLMARLAMSRWGMLTLISGAFGIFRRDLALKVGGFSRDTVGEDYDLVMKIHRYLRKQGEPYAMRYVPEPVCWTEAPEDLMTLANQRKRWQRGALEVFFKHRDILLNLRYGRIGAIAFSLNFLTDVLGPLVELVGYILIPVYWALGLLAPEFMLAYVAVFFAFGLFISICSLALEEMELRRHASARDIAVLAFAALFENFGYRQLNNYWRLQGWLAFLRKDSAWGAMKRKGMT